MATMDTTPASGRKGQTKRPSETIDCACVVPEGIRKKNGPSSSPRVAANRGLIDPDADDVTPGAVSDELSPPGTKRVFSKQHGLDPMGTHTITIEREEKGMPRRHEHAESEYDTASNTSSARDRGRVSDSLRRNQPHGVELPLTKETLQHLDARSRSTSPVQTRRRSDVGSHSAATDNTTRKPPTMP